MKLVVVFCVISALSWTNAFPRVRRLDGKDTDFFVVPFFREMRHPLLPSVIDIPANRESIDSSDESEDVEESEESDSFLPNGFFRPIMFNPFGGFLSRLPDLFTRIRHNVESLNPWNKIVNSTSKTEIINNHKVTVNNTIYSNDDNDGVFRVQIVEVRPLDESSEEVSPTPDTKSSTEDTTDVSEPETNTNVKSKEEKDDDVSVSNDNSAANEIFREEVPVTIPSDVEILHGYKWPIMRDDRRVNKYEQIPVNERLNPLGSDHISSVGRPSLPSSYDIESDEGDHFSFWKNYMKKPYIEDTYRDEHFSPVGSDHVSSGRVSSPSRYDSESDEEDTFSFWNHYLNNPYGQDTYTPYNQDSRLYEPGYRRVGRNLLSFNTKENENTMKQIQRKIVETGQNLILKKENGIENNVNAGKYEIHRKIVETGDNSILRKEIRIENDIYKRKSQIMPKYKHTQDLSRQHLTTNPY